MQKYTFSFPKLRKPYIVLVPAFSSKPKMSRFSYSVSSNQHPVWVLTTYKLSYKLNLKHRSGRGEQRDEGL